MITDLSRGQEFLAEIEKLCRKFNISISHEDQHGAFLLTELDEDYLDWLKGADYGRYEKNAQKGV